MNNRRKLVIALGAGALGTPLGSFAQQQGKVWRVGFLAGVSRPPSLENHRLGGFVQGMRELGYFEGKNLIIEWRFADGKNELLPGLAADLVRLKVDVIVTGSGAATIAAQNATATIPIVIGNSTDAVSLGLAKDLARPSGNVTGLTSIADLNLKRLELLITMASKVALVASLVYAADPDKAAYLKIVQATAESRNVKILPLEASTPQEIDHAFSTMARERAGAIVVKNSALFTQEVRRIADLAVKYRLPSIMGLREYPEAGGLMNYGVSIVGNYRRAATFVDKILRGAKPSNLPLEQPTTFEMFINGKTAKALGLTIPQSLLVMADKVIE